MIKRIIAGFAAAMLSACAHPSLYKISDVTEARAVSNHALDLFNAGENEEAVKALDAVVAYGTIDDNVFSRRAAVQGTLKNYDKAMADMDRAIELAPRKWRHYLERAVLHQRSGRFDAAIGDLDSALTVQPNEGELLRRRAYLKVVAARLDEAIADYETLAEIFPESDTGVLGRGAVLYISGRWPEAARQFNAMLEVRPQDGLAALWYAKARLRDRQPVGWDELENNAGPEPDWRLTRALLTATSRADAEAAVSETEACERDLFLGIWRLVRDGGVDARAAYEAALKSCPRDSIEATEARAELARLPIP